MTRKPKRQRVKSAIDWWIHSVFIGMNGIFLAGLILFREQEALWLYALLLPILICGNWIWIETDYYLDSEALLIRSGPFRERITYSQIESIALTTNFLSSTALSSQRIEIRQKDKNDFLGTTFISPVDRERFFKQLQVKIAQAQK